MLSLISLSKKSEKKGRWIVRLFSKTRPHSFFSESKLHYTCIIARHLCHKNIENHSKTNFWRLSDWRALLHSTLTACTCKWNAICFGKKIVFGLFLYMCVTCYSWVRHVEWRRKRHLKNRSTLSTHPHEEVDRVRKVKYPLNPKVYMNRYTFWPLYTWNALA